MKKEDFTIELNDKVLVISSETSNTIENDKMRLKKKKKILILIMAANHKGRQIRQEWLLGLVSVVLIKGLVYVNGYQSKWITKG